MNENMINQIINEAVNNFINNEEYKEWCDVFMNYVNNFIEELQNDYLSKIGLRIQINTQYNFGRKNWLAVYERSGNKLDDGIISIGLNLPLLYKDMKKLKIVDDLFNIEAQARISVGHEVGHGLIDYFVDYYDGDSKAVNAFVNDYWDGVFDEEELVEEFGKWCFPEATGTWVSELANVLDGILDEI